MKGAGEDEAGPVKPEPEEKGRRAPPAGVPPQLVGAPEWPGAGRYAVLLPSSVVGYTDLEIPLAWNPDGRLAIHVRIQDARYWSRAGGRGAFRD
jgi:hypothetical protein